MKTSKWHFDQRRITVDHSSVQYKFDYYEGYPHYHWAWPSEKLDKPRNQYNDNLTKGVQWLVS